MDDTAPLGTAAHSVAVPRLICGLGNPGDRYALTRHNVGFRVVRTLAERKGLALGGDLCRSRIATADGLTLAAPQTFMNRSGFAVRCLVERLGLEEQAILITYDEIQLPLGRVRLRRAGSPAGHRGMESILENLGTDRVARLRLGVGAADGPPAGQDRVDFVLSPFAEDERDAVTAMIERAADACEVWAEQGIGAAMQAFNG